MPRTGQCCAPPGTHTAFVFYLLAKPRANGLSVSRCRGIRLCFCFAAASVGLTAVPLPCVHACLCVRTYVVRLTFGIVLPPSCLIPQSQLPKCNSYYSEESCKDDCEWDSQLYRCKERGEITPCDDHYEQDTCTASGCNWNSDVYHCSSTGDKIPCTPPIHAIHATHPCWPTHVMAVPWSVSLWGSCRIVYLPNLHNTRVWFL